MASELEKNKSWEEDWWLDAEATELTEGGAPAKTSQEFLSVVRRPTKWFDQFCAQAAADVLQSDLLVFKFSAGHWHFMHKYSARKKVSKTPMCLSLKDQHFVTLDLEE